MTLDEFILQNFGNSVSINDLGSFAAVRVFFNVDNPPALAPGVAQQAEPGSTITIPFTQTPRGPMVVLYTVAEDRRLNKPFAGVLLEEAIEIVHAMKSVKGLVLQSSQEAALVVEKSPNDEVQTR